MHRHAWDVDVDVDVDGPSAVPPWVPPRVGDALSDEEREEYDNDDVGSLEAGEDAMRDEEQRQQRQPAEPPPMPCLLALTMDQCIQSLRRSWQTGNPGLPVPPTAAAGEMAGETVSHADQLVRTPMDIVAAARVVDNAWTHLEIQPEHRRSQVVHPEDARDLYTAFSLRSYHRMRMGIMERVLSAVTRLSLRVRFQTYAPGPEAEWHRMQDLLQRLLPRLYVALGVSNEDALQRC